MSFKNSIKKAGNQILRFLSGEKMIDWGFDKQLGFFLTVFCLVSAFIAWDLMIENRMVEIQKNEQAMEELDIYYHQLTIDLMGMDKRSRVESLLELSGSELKAPVEPPQRVKL